MSKVDSNIVMVTYLCIALGLLGMVWGMLQERTYRIMYGAALLLVGIGGLFGRSNISLFFFVLGGAMWLAGTLNRRRIMTRRGN